MTEAARESHDGDTRQVILSILLHQGPRSAADLSAELGISAAGVRRHLDNLQDEGLVEAAPIPRSRRRGRGRPARSFRLTDAGRDSFGHDYDALAASALEALRQVGGDEAVVEFASRRIRSVLAEIEPAESTPESVISTAQAIARAMSETGHVATATVTANGCGIQLSQHHCPVCHVAEEVPELCAAEHRMVSSLVGQHIQPLATIAGGHGICTTYIPIYPVNTPPDERSGQ